MIDPPELSHERRHVYDYDPHVHVDPGCQWPRCGRASCGSLDGVPLCDEHADITLERWAALAIAPAADGLFPLLVDL